MEMAAGLRTRFISRLKAVERRLDASRSIVPLSPVPMDSYPQVSGPVELLQAGGTVFWEAYPTMTLPKHAGFRWDLSHETPTAPVPKWMRNDSGCWKPPVRFAGMRDATLWLFDGVALNQQGEVLSESLYTLQERSQDLTAMPGARKRRNHTVFHRNTLKKAAVIDEPVLLAANGWYRAFGHWIYDTLTAVRTFIEPIRAGELKVIIPELSPWQRAWLALLEIPEAAIIEAGSGFVKARQAIISSTLSVQNVRHPGQHTVDLIDFLRKGSLPSASNSPFLYLSRASQGETSHRTLANEGEIMAALTTLGFRCVAPETLTPAEQITLFAQARVILGPVGSAFALSGLAAKEACVVEILPPPAAHSWMYRSSANFQHFYGCIMAEVLPDSRRDLDDKGISRPGWFYSYTADPKVVIKVAEQAMHLSQPTAA